MKTLQLEAPTIKRGACLETIRSALTRCAGVEAVEGDPNKREVTVTFDPDQLSEGAIRAAISSAGFLVG